ncbi:MarR family winged helix-turn-helix transcriptional regulator [Lactobacillus sp. CBA3605]|uniref:MarR family winged helix-turn-helix transcriptional regulator n=1 Tax=Lactobacillus sp. CBA3605 TaxID=2099788 RepID=UPI001319DDFD|nr:MarR family transcriptional regulator [Lactobacillus sp. CBA3605]
MDFEKNIAIINRATRQHLAQQLKPYTLTESNFMLVLRVCERPGISQEALNQDIYREHSIVTKMVKRLITLGWLQRVTDPQDRRRTQLFPTTQAQTAYPEIKALLAETNQWLVAELTSTEQAALAPALQRLAKSKRPAKTES